MKLGKMKSGLWHGPHKVKFSVAKSAENCTSFNTISVQLSRFIFAVIDIMQFYLNVDKSLFKSLYVEIHAK